MKEYLVCIDSDGCVMDTMNYKHELCFGPLAAEIFEVKDVETFLKLWYEVNLFSKTRGINRYKGLVYTFEKMSKVDKDVKPLNDVAEWVSENSKLSFDTLNEAIEKTNSEELKKAYLWSKKVNEKIHSLTGYDKVFDGAKEAFPKIKEYCDIAIVSSANKEALNSEWERHGLLQYVDEVMGQERGSKKECINYLLNKGYSKNKMIMLGDSPGDLDSAKENGILFYPIMFGEEKKSWETFANVVLDEFINSNYDDEKYIEKYNEKLEKFSN